MSKMNMAIPNFFQPRERVGPIGVGVMDDPTPPFHVFGEGGSRVGGRESSSEESESGNGDD
ncbi:hypothetical protein Hanom_Chr11g01027501 [Helianthus anomalus]